MVQNDHDLSAAPSGNPTHSCVLLQGSFHLSFIPQRCGVHSQQCQCLVTAPSHTSSFSFSNRQNHRDLKQYLSVFTGLCKCFPAWLFCTSLQAKNCSTNWERHTGCGLAFVVTPGKQENRNTFRPHRSHTTGHILFSLPKRHTKRNCLRDGCLLSQHNIVLLVHFGTAQLVHKSLTKAKLSLRCKFRVSQSLLCTSIPVHRRRFCVWNNTRPGTGTCSTLRGKTFAEA